jgi:hypothetical protein
MLSGHGRADVVRGDREMNRTDFDAFVVPDASRLDPEMALLDHDERGVQVRYPDATPAWMDSMASALLGAREALSARSAAEIAEVLGRVGSRFLDIGDPLREEALKQLPPTTGLSPEMAEAVLDGMAAHWTAERLMTLLRTELGTELALDSFEDSKMAVGPSLCVQIVAGGVPGVGVTALLRSLLLKGPTLLKPGRGDVVLPVLFARALREADSELADALAVVYWPGGQRALEDAALARADVVTAYGSDQTVADLRVRTPVTARFVAYHHRVSVGVVGRDALTEDRLEPMVAEVAEAIALFDQRGCVSPQVIFIEEGGARGPDVFARALAEQLRVLEGRLPSGDLDDQEASGLHQLRGTAELLAAAGEIELIHGGEAPWTVILEADSSPPVGCRGRVIRLRAVPDAGDIPALLAPLGQHLQTVGVAGLGDRLEAAAQALGRVGASRVVPFRSVAFPPPWWHHDGRGPLLDLLRWVDLEGE